MNSRASILLPTIFSCLLWGSAFAGAKIGFQYVPPISLSGMRFILAGLLLFPLIYFKRIPVLANLKQWKFMIVFALAQTFLQYGLFFMGLNKVPAATAAIIIGGGPLFVAIMAHLSLRTDKMTLRKFVAIVLGLSGVVFISLAKGEETLSDQPDFYTGVAFLILSNIIGGYTNIMVVKRKEPINPIVLIAFANFFGGVLLLLAGLAIEKPVLGNYPLEFYPALLWLSVISAVAFSIWYTLLQKPGVKVSELNMWKFIIPVSGCILSWILIADEHPDWKSITGIAIITIALQILQLPKSWIPRLKKRKQEKPVSPSDEGQQTDQKDLLDFAEGRGENEKDFMTDFTEK